MLWDGPLGHRAPFFLQALALSSDSLLLTTTGQIVNLLANDVNHFDEVVEIKLEQFHPSRLEFDFFFSFSSVDYPGAALSVGGTSSSIGDHHSPLVRSWSVLSGRFGSYYLPASYTDLFWKAFWFVQVSHDKKSLPALV